MTTITLYWNHICVLHRQEKSFLEQLAVRLRQRDIELKVRYFGLGYPEHLSEYLARPDAVLPDLILSADLEVFEDPRIFGKLKNQLYPASTWLPLRPLSSLEMVRRGPCLLPVAAIPLMYFTRQPQLCAQTPLSALPGLAFGGINNSAAKTIVKAVWEREGKATAAALLERSLVTDMPIGAFQAVRQGQASTALVPSLYGLRADGHETFLCPPQEGPVLIPSYFCACTSAPEWAARCVAEALLCPELCNFYVANGDLLIYPDSTALHSRQEGSRALCPSAGWLEQLDPQEFYALYCSALPTAKDPAALM